MDTTTVTATAATETVNLKNLHDQLRSLMAEYGMPNATVFVKAEVRYYKSANKTEQDLRASLWFGEGEPSLNTGDIHSVTGSSIAGILLQAKGKIVDYLAINEGSELVVELPIETPAN